jgi:hypothetical protein
MLPEKPQIRLHCDLDKNEVPEAGWFPEYIEANDKDNVETLCCLEISIQGLKNGDLLYDQAAQSLAEMVWKLSSGILGAAYLVLVEHQSLPKSKVRTHKGLFPYKGRIKQGDFIEYEVDLEAGWSYIVGISPVTVTNRDECLSLMRDPSQGLVVLTGQQKNEGVGELLLDRLIPGLSIYPSPNNKGCPRINYMKLIPKLCNLGLIILSFGPGDSRGEYANIRLFFHTRIKGMVQEAANISVRPKQ